ncbi:endonuclease/exonuclease/phosphatase family protein [Antarcticibacterium sp. 1MA-6-2]|uniref:endonuclease/exonuclease/phosphatase family protein n=1 Tax=Antarcticibacterium sp. 1MA-6-2 TaxID=2908210 RepID=UPI001F467B12|nr:endonuclease/exonuclease/phosphatase family protein [Antarcticibacterium sp. 1MA-6-2]UJH90084.1 endonuclease/exonuclease/phosphatase family protein [Antarcticibacterium sp. 1MA-6-2]
MKKLGFLLILLMSITAHSQCKEDLVVMSYNIRWNSPDDGINSWDNRKDWVTSSIVFFGADLVGAQEVTITQLKDMEKLLPKFGHVGVGRDGGQKGEFSPIFYVKERFELLENNTFWLSDTPEIVGSKGWDAALPRIVTWAKFRDKAKGITFYFFNSHFDHRGETARKNSAKVLTTRISEIAGEEPVILTGDFNTPPDSEPYVILNKTLDDVFEALNSDQIYSPGYTFNSWDIEAKGDRYRIDYIFYAGNKLSPRKYHVLDGQRGKRFISDHFPVIVTFEYINGSDSKN